MSITPGKDEFFFSKIHALFHTVPKISTPHRTLICPPISCLPPCTRLPSPALASRSSLSSLLHLQGQWAAQSTHGWTLSWLHQIGLPPPRAQQAALVLLRAALTHVV
jgi:hypothetical protein